MNSAKSTLLLTAILAATLLYLQLSEYNFDHTRFIRAGDYFVNASKVPGNINILQNSPGYDGQFFYRLALKPNTGRKLDFGIEFDNPPWRQKRILYPLITWMLSFGSPTLTTWMLIIVNFIALCIIGWIGGLYAKNAGLNALWGMAFPLYGGFVFTITHNLSEIVEITFILATFYLLKSKKQLWATLTLTLAVFTKEPSLFIAWAGFLVFLYGFINKKEDIKWYFPIIPGITCTIWHFLLYIHWGASMKSDFIDKIGIPFASFIKLLNKNAPYAAKPNYICFIELTIILLFMLSVILSLRKSMSGLIVKIAWLHYFTLIISLTEPAYWVNDGEFMRVLTEFFATGTLILMNSRFILRKTIFLINIGLCIYLAYMFLYYPFIPRYSIEERQVAENKPVVLTDFNPVHFNLELEPQKYRYRTGERLILRFDLYAKSALNIDIYFVLLSNDNKLHYAPSWKSKPEVFLKNFKISGNTKMDNVILFEFDIPKTLAPMSGKAFYTFAIGAVKTGTPHFISNISTLTLEVAP